MPTDGFSKAKANSKPLQEFMATPEVSEWLEIEVRGKETKRTYASALFRYWTGFLSKTYPTLKAWIEAVRTQRESKEANVRKTWAIDLQRFMDTQKTPNGQIMASPTRWLFSSSVKSFLRHFVDEELDHDFKISDTTEQLRKKQNEEAMSLEEMRKLYEACRTTRDKALILVAANGVSPDEIVQFTDIWKEWFPKNPNDLKAPFRVKLIREKKKIPYHVTLFEDACEALRTLFEERLQKTGSSSKQNLKDLFIAEDETPFTKKTYQRLWENLRERAGLAKKVVWEREHVHPHGVRHFFKTASKNYPVDQAVIEYAMGHSGDRYGYDKSSCKDEKWCKKVETELAKMSEVLNLKTGISQKRFESREEELRAKIAKDTYKTLIETGALKPETLTTPVLEVIAKKLGIKFETLVLGGTMIAQDYDTFHKFHPGEYQELLKLPLQERRKKFLDLRPYPKAEVETRLRLQLFDIVSNAIGLDTQVYNKYYDAIKVLTENTAQSSWENHTDYYTRVEIGSDAHMQALADGFKVIDSDGKMRILQKPKSLPPPLVNNEHRKTGVASTL
jgi:site-specific recombinase XerD